MQSCVPCNSQHIWKCPVHKHLIMYILLAHDIWKVWSISQGIRKRQIKNKMSNCILLIGCRDFEEDVGLMGLLHYTLSVAVWIDKTKLENHSVLSCRTEHLYPLWCSHSLSQHNLWRNFWTQLQECIIIFTVILFWFFENGRKLSNCMTIHE